MEIVKILYNGRGIKNYDYASEDVGLITSNLINGRFNTDTDNVEFFIFDENQSILVSDYNFANYKTPSEYNIVNNDYSALKFDPEADVKSFGYDRGTVYVQYNFCRNLFNSSLTKKYWIKEISNSRTELKLSSQTIGGDSMRSGLLQYQSYFSNKNYYPEFLLNFGSNQFVIGVNAAYVEQDDQAFLLVKLYEPLPIEYDLKAQLWIVDKVAESVNYQVNISVESTVVDTTNYLRRPNFNIRTFEKVGQNTPYYNYDSLFSSPFSSSIQQLRSYYEDRAISINVDYSNFQNFVHFSSAVERINNFTYKVGLIETYKEQIVSQSNSNTNASIISSNIEIAESNIDRIIEKFDTYEYFLYYESSSYAWPKSTSQKPYQLYSVTSSQVINWLGDIDTPNTMLYDAYSYDTDNKDILRGVIPQYLQDDSNNQPYVTFIDMVGQHFDNIWLYYKDVSNRYNATNNPYTGVSLDVVADALKAFGISLYTNTNVSNELYYNLFGLSQLGSILPPTGSEGSAIYPITIVTSSLDTLPYSQIEKEVYKRLYHNLPYLLKTKGTSRSIKALIACYGIPEEILTVNEFGGYDRYDRTGIQEINNNKINIISQSLELSQSVLSPYATLQYFDNDNRLNSTTVEVGFSPSDVINDHLSSSVGYFNIDNLIGNPTHQYSGSYPDLNSYRDSYFSTYYLYNKSVWEYIRLLKFYNNSLFKIIKDFVPARANISTGIIIKPHILERNRYARNEPSGSDHTHNTSIEILDISGSHATSYFGPNQVRRLITTSIGYIPSTSSFEYEKYTGEFEGTEFRARTSPSFEQKESSERPMDFGNTINQDQLIAQNASFDTYRLAESSHGLGSVAVLRRANFQNVVDSVRSIKYFDLDYSYNAKVPVNFGIITASISRSQVDNYATYTDPSVPYARIQDYNYYLQRSLIPRYIGSKVESLRYNRYTPPSPGWRGDSSYGNSPAIDHISKKIALFTQIETSSYLPGRVNATLGYLVDQSSGLYELNLLNQNWFEVQNIFKSGRNLTIKQFDNKKYVNQKSTDGIKYIFESGYNYTPILYFSTGSDKRIYYDLAFPPNAGILATNNPDSVGNRFIQGHPTPNYPLTPGIAPTSSIFDIFNYEEINSENLYVPGTSSLQRFPTYSVNYNGSYKVDINVDLLYEMKNATSASYQFVIKRNGVTQNVRTFNISEFGDLVVVSSMADPRFWRVSLTYVYMGFSGGSYVYDAYYSMEYRGSDRVVSGLATNGDYTLPNQQGVNEIQVRITTRPQSSQWFFQQPTISPRFGYQNPNISGGRYSNTLIAPTPAYASPPTFITRMAPLSYTLAETGKFRYLAGSPFTGIQSGGSPDQGSLPLDPDAPTGGLGTVVGGISGGTSGGTYILPKYTENVRTFTIFVIT